jgi:omega-hydroxy-beta-dihydromenaquinone-9 sulfotransferase
MSRQYLNLTAGAWRQLRRNWDPSPTPLLFWQTLVPGSLFSLLENIQNATARSQLAAAECRNAVVILGYWRSGTTLLHELLALDPRYTFPTTHACMNPQHFLLSEAAVLARNHSSTPRPMDEMEVRLGSPQEDEFALLALGARSPYEALILPEKLHQALKLADPQDLTPPEESRWRSIFLSFLRGISVRGGERPIILKSPTHGFRVATLRRLLPDARFILVVRDPYTNFESVVRMWRRMFETYALGPIPSDDEIREAVLADRPRFEAKLTAGAAGLSEDRFAVLKYESLIANPVDEIEQLYRRLELGNFAMLREAISGEAEHRRVYRAKGQLPTDPWKERIGMDWSRIFTEYGYGRGKRSTLPSVNSRTPLHA